jgi:hypothetical protein
LGQMATSARVVVTRRRIEAVGDTAVQISNSGPSDHAADMPSPMLAITAWNASKQATSAARRPPDKSGAYQRSHACHDRNITQTKCGMHKLCISLIWRKSRPAADGSRRLDLPLLRARARSMHFRAILGLAMVLLGVATAIVPAVTRPCPAPQLEQKAQESTAATGREGGCPGSYLSGATSHDTARTCKTCPPEASP